MKCSPEEAEKYANGAYDSYVATYGKSSSVINKDDPTFSAFVFYKAMGDLWFGGAYLRAEHICKETWSNVVIQVTWIIRSNNQMQFDIIYVVGPFERIKMFIVTNWQYRLKHIIRLNILTFSITKSQPGAMPTTEMI